MTALGLLALLDISSANCEQSDAHFDLLKHITRRTSCSYATALLRFVRDASRPLCFKHLPTKATPSTAGYRVGQRLCDLLLQVLRLEQVGRLTEVGVAAIAESCRRLRVALVVLMPLLLV